MDAEKFQDIIEEIDMCVGGLENAQKQLKKRSTVSFAERHGLTQKATKAIDELRAQKEKLEAVPEEATDEDREALVQETREVINRVGKLFGNLEFLQKMGKNKLIQNVAGKFLGGQKDHETGGSQVRAPDRIGG